MGGRFKQTELRPSDTGHQSWCLGQNVLSEWLDGNQREIWFQVNKSVQTTKWGFI